jgi:hypothetical protein
MRWWRLAGPSAIEKLSGGITKCLDAPVKISLSEIGEGGGFGFEGGDGFDEAGDGEGVADAALAADQAEHAAFAGELDGDAHERGDAGAVDLRDAVQDDDNFLRAPFDHGFESVVELLGRLADGEAAANFEHGDSAGLADVDFHGQPVSHGSASDYPHWIAMAIGHAERHYTLEGKLHKGNVLEDYRPTRAEPEERRITKTNSGNANFKLGRGVRMRIMQGDKLAGPRKRNPEPAERTYL